MAQMCGVYLICLRRLSAVAQLSCQLDSSHMSCWAATVLCVVLKTAFVIRQLRLPEDVEQTLKILVMMPKQLACELASEEQAGPADNTLDAGMWGPICAWQLSIAADNFAKGYPACWKAYAGRHMLNGKARAGRHMKGTCCMAHAEWHVLKCTS